jgi:hypothetical protein
VLCPARGRGVCAGHRPAVGALLPMQLSEASQHPGSRLRIVTFIEGPLSCRILRGIL